MDLKGITHLIWSKFLKNVYNNKNNVLSIFIRGLQILYLLMQQIANNVEKYNSHYNKNCKGSKVHIVYTPKIL